MKTKDNLKALSITTVLLACFLLITGCGGKSSTGENAEFVIYKNTKYGFKLQRPANWKIELENGEGHLAVGLSFSGGALNVGVVDLGATGKTLEGVTEAKLAFITDPSKQLGFSVDKSKTEKSETTLAGNHASKIVYTAVDSETKEKWKNMEVITIKDNKMYSLAYHVYADQFSRDEKTFQKINDSFEFI